MLFNCRVFRERPGQHELGLEHGVEVVDESVEGRRHPSLHRMLDPALTVRDGSSGVALVPGPVERLSGDAELDDEIVRQVLGFGLAALFLPQPDQRRLVRAHDDSGVRPADKKPAVSPYRIRSRRKVAQGQFH